ncbi:MAG: nucleotidyltransferase domain-containing protein [Candidatus Nanoarchaeia archaeon]|nr:nucleotidyltransferase domain-containing protein [Candidatus Nanoarchaeia archaeon]
MRPLTKKQILRTLETHRAEIKGFGVNKIGLFGSYLKGRPRRSSDVDILVRFKKPTFDGYMGLKFMLERKFRRKVDLVSEDSLKPALRYVKEDAAYVKRM